MGSIPQLSIVKGPTRQLIPNELNRIFENVANGPTGNNVALIFNDNGNPKTITYSDLDRITNKLARSITKLIGERQLQRNSDGDYLIAVDLSPSDCLVVTLLAIWKAGAAYLPLDRAFPGPRVEHILREARPVLVIYEEDSNSYVNTCKISFEELYARSATNSEMTLKENERVHPMKDNLAIVLYTSGSTGVPKGVRIPHQIILNRLQWQFKTFPFSSSEKVCVFKTALTFVDSVCEIWGPLISGLSLLIVPRPLTKDPEKLIAILEDYQIERLVLVPSLLRSLLLYMEMHPKKQMLRNLKTWVCSGETLSVALAEEFFKYFPASDHQLCNFYGSTEIMGDVTFYVISGPQQLRHLHKIPIGVPIDNTIIYLLDSDFRPVKAGDTGELFVSGLNLASGYVNGRDPEKFVENPLAIDPTFARLYRTGDFAKLEKGMLLYEGRTDSQVKIRGHRVDLSEVEKAVSQVPGVDKAVVLCCKPGEMSQALLAFVTTSGLISEQQIETALKSRLTSYMMPQVILVENIPLLVNGKTDRQELLKMYERTNNNDDPSYEVEINYDNVPADKMQAAKDLFETVASVLNRAARSAISVDANFYEIGGNSLNSIYTISRLADKGYHISISDFISAMDFGEVLQRMTSDTQIITAPPSFSVEMLKPEHKDIVIDMVTTSFYQKADLEQWIISEISEADYDELLEVVWEPLLEKDLSFIVRSESGKIIGVALNFDARDEPEVEIDSKLAVIFEFLEAIEGPIRDNQLPPGKNQALHVMMMATHASLSAKENVAVMQYMEEEVIKLAKSKRFAGVFTTNTSPLTQQLGTDIYKYRVMLDYQVNQYVASDNTKPFGLAPDDQRAIVQWKPVQ